MATIDDEIDANLAWRTAAGDGLKRAVEELARKWAAEAQNLAGSRDAQNIAYLRRELQRQLQQLGLDDLANQLNATQDEALTRAIEVTSQTVEGRVAQLDPDVVKNLQATSYQWLQDIGTEAVIEVSQYVAQNAIAGLPRSEMIKGIRESLEGRFAAYAGTYVDTALVSFDRRATFDMWVAAGVEEFRYGGPKDLRNRQFCAQHVNKVFSLAEILKMPPPSRLGPIQYAMAGYNCRHIFRPVFRDNASAAGEAQNAEEENEP